MIYDTFLFNDETELLKLRLTELWNVVDRFVLVEARENHRGNPKRLFYSDNKADFEKWNSKIDSLIIDTYGFSGDNKPANMQREHIGRESLNDYPWEPGSTIIHGDADEICDPDIVCPSGPMAIEMMFTYYFFNCLYPTTTKRSIVASVDCYRNNGFDNMRWKVTDTSPVIPDGGWHHSYLGGAQALKDKIAAHVEGEPSDWALKEDNAVLQSRIDAGKLFDGSQQFNFIPIDHRQSQYVRDNQVALTEKGLIKPIPSVTQA